MIFSMNLVCYHCPCEAAMFCYPNRTKEPNKWLQCSHTSGKEISRAEKRRIKWYISWRWDEKKYTQLFMHLSNIKCLLQRKCLYVVSGKTDPDFQVQVPRKWMIAARLGSWCSRHCNGHLWAAECCWEPNLVSAEYRRSYQWDCRFPYHLSF